MKRQMSKVKSVFLLIKLLFCFLLIISCTVNNNDNSVKEPEYTVALLNTQDYPNCTFIYNISVEGSEIVSQKSTTDSFFKFSTSLSGRMQIRIYAVENIIHVHAFVSCSFGNHLNVLVYAYRIGNRIGK